MAIKLPNIPAISSRVDSEVKRAIDALRSWVETLGSDGGPITKSSISAAVESVSALSPFFDGTIPPQLLSVTAHGGFKSITITWDDPQYKPLAYVEVWRNTSDDLGSSIRIGTTLSTIYSDTPPDASLSVDYYYWIRAVSVSGIVGPWNDTSGTKGSTANDPAYMIDLLSTSLDSVTPTVNAVDLVFAAERFALRMAGDAPGTFQYPFIVAAVPGSDPVEYGVFINAAYIKEGTISSAMVGSLSADKLYVSTGTIADAIIGEGHITNAMVGTIESDNYIKDTQGWKIDKNGTVDLNGGTFRGAVEFTTGSTGYDNLADKPTSLSDLDPTAASDISTAVSDAGDAISAVNGWTRPGTTKIDGDQIYTGDAYVDTLQIKGNAVTLTVASSLSSDASSGYASWTDSGLSVTQEIDANAPAAILIMANIVGTIYVSVTGNGAYTGVLYYGLYRNSSLLKSGILAYLTGAEAGDGTSYFSQNGNVTFIYQDSPSAGDAIYTVKTYYIGGYDADVLAGSNIVALGTKR